MKLNEGREGYKETAIGWIPEDWTLEPFEELFKIQIIGIKGK